MEGMTWLVCVAILLLMFRPAIEHRPGRRTRWQAFWADQLWLAQRYADRHDVSGGDALDALAAQERGDPEGNAA